MWKFENFSSTQYLREINFARVGLSKIVNYWQIFGKLHNFKSRRKLEFPHCVLAKAVMFFEKTKNNWAWNSSLLSRQMLCWPKMSRSNCRNVAVSSEYYTLEYRLIGRFQTLRATIFWGAFYLVEGLEETSTLPFGELLFILMLWITSRLTPEAKIS